MNKTKRHLKCVNNQQLKSQFFPITQKNIFWGKGYAGLHLVADFWYPKNIEDKNEFNKILKEAAKKGGNTPLKTAVHKFNPHGITGIILLAESHIALHSWPEFNYLAVDIFTCGKKSMPAKALEYLKEVFQPKEIKITEIKRGKI